MAQAMFEKLAGGLVEVMSAGVEPWPKCHPMALKLMAQQGLDMSDHFPKHVNKFIEADLDIVVTIGDRAENESPEFKCKPMRIFWDIPDPADADNTDKSEDVFRWTCQEIADSLPQLLQKIKNLPRKESQQ